MRPCNFRSLLLAAIVLSNCITWTASKHHFTNNVSGHRSRHRRQGAGLYLPSSYVIPGGEGTGWGEWGQVSPCSRTCGVGVASQKRICLQVNSDGQKLCTGGDTKYFSCGTQDCPKGSQDFRAEQCSEYNNKNIGGRTYEVWEPFTSASNPCQLNCMPRGERFYYTHKNAVVDGTRCNEDSYDICVQGTCQPVGCDRMLGSNAKEDKCRECRGNGANCSTRRGLLNKQTIKGYTDILLIPQGATSIKIAEVKPSINYLSLRSKNGTYYFNGNYHIDFPRSFSIDDNIWHYERSQQGFPAPDKLRSLGPTTEPLYLSILTQDVNVGIKYEYSLPNFLASAPTQAYSWVYNDFTPCSASCGGGFQNRNVTCSSSSGDLKQVDDVLCNEALRPVANQTCNLHECPAQWIEGPWSACSKPCGDGGTKSRNVYCQKLITNGDSFSFPSVVADKECFDMLGNKPKLFEKCNQNATCPTWYTGSWTPCDKLCDEGRQFRKVVCNLKTGGKVQVFNDTECLDKKPTTEQSCILEPCKSVDWIVTDWSGCDTCLSKIRTRHAECVTLDKEVVNSSFCSHRQQPILEEPCLKEKLPPCQGQWYATQWSKCSVICGKGIQARHVFCGIFNGTVVTPVDDSICANQTKYNDTKPCEVPYDQCPAQWYAGPWSECDKKCGNGRQNRIVVYLQNGKETIAETFGETLDTTQSCNRKPCEEVKHNNEDDLPLCDSDDENYPESGFEIMTTEDNYIADEGSGRGDIGFEPESVIVPKLDDNSTVAQSLEEDQVTIVKNGTELLSEGFVTSDSTTPDDFDSTETENETTATEDPIITTGSSDSPSGNETTTTAATIITTGSSDSPSGNETTTTAATIITTGSSDSPSGNETTTAAAPIITTGSSNSSSGNETTTAAAPIITTGSSDSPSGNETTTTAPTIITTGLSDSPSGNETTTTAATIITTGSSNSPSGNETTTTAATIITTGSSNSPSGNETTTTAATIITTGSSDSPSGNETTTTAATIITTGSSDSISGNETTTTAATIITTGSSDSPSGNETTTTAATIIATGSSNSPSGNETTTTAATIITTGSSDSPSGNETTTTTATIITTGSSNSPSGNETTTTAATIITTGSSNSPSGNETTTTAATIITTGSSDSISGNETTTTAATIITTGSSDSISGNETTTTAATIITTGSSNSPSGNETTTTAATIITTGSSDSPSGNETTTTTATIITTGSSNSPSGNETTTAAAPIVTTGSSNSPSGNETTTTAAPIITTGSSNSPSGNETTTTAAPIVTTGSSNSPSGNKTTTAAAPIVTTGSSNSPSGNETTNTATPMVTTRSTNSPSGNETTTAAAPIITTGSSNSPSENETTTAAAPIITTGSSSSPSENETASTAAPIITTGSSNSPSGNETTTTAATIITTGSSNSPSGNETTTTSIPVTTVGTTARIPWATTVGPRQCKPRIPCVNSTYGCCPDKKTPASGPFDEGCPKKAKTCNETEYLCCPDGVSPALGPKGEGCPVPSCSDTLFGCCMSDNKTAAEGNEQEGCPQPPAPCLSSNYGCCNDGETEATGPDMAGCPELTTSTIASTTIEYSCTESTYGCCYDNETEASGPDAKGCPCNTTQFGCCPDGVSSAQGKEGEGCMDTCHNTTHGCCPDGRTPAHGPDHEGCCLTSRFGCCLDNYKEAEGPNQEGCECQNAQFGCCPDNKTFARGTYNEGCGCQYSDHGCCPDRHTKANGPNFEDCDCHTFQFGCCPDGVSAATGPNLEGCHCSTSKYGCCGDGETAASGPNLVGCDCSSSMYGCCSDGKTEAKGPNFDGCTKLPENKQAVCSLVKDRGPCVNYTVYWYYDTVYGGCDRFWYGGCDGNGNRFNSKEDCEDVCVRPPRIDVCKLPKIKGACVGYNLHWYYDSERDQCNQFVYGGCLGNKNNFETKQLCQKTCQPEKILSQCNLPMEKGPCKGKFGRWAFSSDKQLCQQFYWGGCEGNSNRFTSKAACMMQCNPPRTSNLRCTLPQEPGNCNEIQALWSFNQTVNQCVPFYYTGCLGNDNRFNSFEQCTDACPSAYEPSECTLPSAAGECGKFTEKWFYDTTKKMCSTFYYGGCGGNGNNFDSQKECEGRCSEPIIPTAPPDQTADICKLPMMTGPCDESMKRWFYDGTSNSCSQFTYGGCEGNANRFETKGDCEKRCQTDLETTSTPDITTPSQVSSSTTTAKQTTSESPGSCQVSPALEQCVGGGEVWYLDTTFGECVSHNNSGTGVTCRTTGVFNSQEDCESSCGVIKLNSECKLSPEMGVCQSRYVMWFYDVTKHECDQFVYSGCGGNNNRFETLKDCKTYCKTSAVTTPAATTIISTTSSSTPMSSSPSSSTLDSSTLDSSTLSSSTLDSSTLDSSTFSSSTLDASTPSSSTLDSSTSSSSTLDTSTLSSSSPSTSTIDSSTSSSSTLDSSTLSSSTLDSSTSSPSTLDSSTTSSSTTNSSTSDSSTTITTIASSSTAFVDVPEGCQVSQALEQCAGAGEVWYLDQTRSECVSHINSDTGLTCRTTGVFGSQEACERSCGVFRDIDVCRYAMEPGQCRMFVPKYYFDGKSGGCKVFHYGGCLGGPNRFSTLEECMQVCEPYIIKDPCKQYPEAGNCLSRYIMWYYDESREQCGQFVYTGCGGNSNRFKSREDCEGQCKYPNNVQTTTTTTTVSPVTAPTERVTDECRTPESLVPCDGDVTVFYYDSNNKKCVESNIGGCGHANSYQTQEDCEKRCGANRDINPCKQYPEQGNCLSRYVMWYYDESRDMCGQFIYTGCGGNGNRFNTREDCEGQCRFSNTPSTRATITSSTAAITSSTAAITSSTAAVSRDIDPCKQYPEAGNCLSRYIMWYYDESREMCGQFVYTGCGGNNNRFKSREDCEGQCRYPSNLLTTSTIAPVSPPSQKVADECRTPESLVPCGENVTVFYYDSNNKKCVESNIGGCGHANSYLTEEECERRCGANRDINPCKQYPEQGNCLSRYDMWYYDEATDMCRQFIYTGCGGNDNRFHSREECEGVCKYQNNVQTTTTTTSPITPTTEHVTDECRTPESLVPCDGDVTVFYYDSSNKKCVESNIGGCRHANSYRTEEECERRCGAFRDINVCEASLDPGSCRESITKFYWDSASGSCQTYAYGGCHGGPNRFSSIDECFEVCGNSGPAAACLQEVDSGTLGPDCGPSVRRWHYNVLLANCTVFVYQGCGGNKNNFVSYDQCADLCKIRRPGQDNVVPNCDSYNEECSRVQCEHGVVRTPTEDGCERCTCKEVDKCELATLQCTTLQCSYGVETTTDNNGCSKCSCLQHPCATISCSAGERCVATAYRDSTTQEVKYSAVCETESNEILPDCDRFNDECAQLRCDYGVQRTRTAHGCERCSCVTLEVNCAPHKEDCERKQCSYGKETYMDPDGCQRCKCKNHPCDGVSCLAGERCVPTPYRDAVTQETKYMTECNIMNKPGSCPPEELASTESSCRRTCNDDADCRGVGKCCVHGCSRLCLVPASPTSPVPRTTTYPPEIPHAPQSLPETEPEVTASEGGKATLRCLFHANPPPKITWTRGEIKIDGNVGRYRLLSDGALEIVSLYRNDSGVYICVADNGLGIARQEIRLQVSDPVKTPVGIAGEQNAVVTGVFGRSLVLRCLAYGYPTPNVFWYRGLTGPMVPYSSTLYEARGNVLRIKKITYETLGEYACQAYNGEDRPASWSIIVQAYRPVGYLVKNPYLVDREDGIDIAPREPDNEVIAVTTSSTTPEPDIAVFTVPVSTKLSAQYTTIPTGTELSLPCEVDGYPDPDIHWTKDGVRLEPSDRITITGASVSLLTVLRVTVNDSGEYGCHARNEYSSDYSTAHITVQGLVIPSKCTDNQLFAKCSLIVRSKFCKHKYYSRFCCKSCMEAGQLNPEDLELHADQPWTYRK